MRLLDHFELGLVHGSARQEFASKRTMLKGQEESVEFSEMGMPALPYGINFRCLSRK
jgi:hypothetical protein